MRNIVSVLRIWIPLAVVTTLVFAGIYGAAQHTLRISANDPQIQLAEDTARALEAGSTPESVTAGAPVDIAASLAPFLVVYDDGGRPAAATGRLHNQMPELPPGVLEYVRQRGEDRISWQPEPQMRNAIVVARVRGAHAGFVMAGRSLREVETRIDTIGLLLVAGWAGTCLATLAAVILTEWLLARRIA